MINNYLPKLINLKIIAPRALMVINEGRVFLIQNKRRFASAKRRRRRRRMFSSSEEEGKKKKQKNNKNK